MPTWTLHPDRALPADPGVRPVAREIYESVKDLPTVSMHGHVESELLSRNEAFPDPAELLVRPDHYLVRMLVSQGVHHGDLGVGKPGAPGVETDPRAIWRTFCSHWKLYRGTPTRYWMEDVLAERFGVSAPPSAENADVLFEEISERLATDAYRPLALLDTFKLEVIATTDAASSDLAHHRELAGRGYGERILPTFRPDAVVYPARAGFAEQVDLLEQASGITITSFPTYLDALRQRREYFIANGARATDHGHLSASTEPLEPSEAERILLAGRRGEASAVESEAFAATMLFEFARMSCEDGLTMQVHPGVLRDHDPATFDLRGPDVGFDIPVATEYTRALRPLLAEFGTNENLTLVVFTVDETAFSRELAPLAGVYPAMRLGAPWWFLDTPDAMRRYREAVTDTAGFYNTTGFVDDTRAFFSIPARHDLARRIDAGHLARLVAEHRLSLDEALETAADLAYNLPKAAYPALRGAGTGVGAGASAVTTAALNGARRG